MTKQFLADAAANHDHPFWSDRTDPPQARDVEAVRAAFESLRHAESIGLRVAATVSFAERPTVSASEIVLEPRLVTDAEPGGVRYVCDVDLLVLCELAPRFSQVPDLFEAYNRRGAPVALPDFLSALSTAVARRWLIADA